MVCWVCVFVINGCFDVFMWFCIIFRIYEHIWKYVLAIVWSSRKNVNNNYIFIYIYVYIYYIIFLYIIYTCIYIYIYVHTHRTAYSGSSSGSNSGAPTSLVGGTPGWPGWGAADWSGQDATAATAAAAAVCCSMMYIYIYIYMCVSVRVVWQLRKQIKHMFLNESIYTK